MKICPQLKFICDNMTYIRFTKERVALMTTKRRLIEVLHSVVFVRGDLLLAHGESINSGADHI